MPWAAETLLSAWESGAQVTPAARTAVLLALDEQSPSLSEALDLDVGEAARRVGRSYAESFGRMLDVVVSCPACGELLEAEVPLPEFDADERTSRELEGWMLRLPTLAELDGARRTGGAEHALRDACLVAVDGSAPAPADDAVDAALEELAGAALLRGSVECDACGSAFSADLDLSALLWERICFEAPLLLADVATIAARFGWAEVDILALSAVRRDFYLAIAAASG